MTTAKSERERKMTEKVRTFGDDKQSVTITKERLDQLMETVRQLYLADEIPWIIGYSGGKDSTATLQLVWLSLSTLSKEQLNKQVHIINTDTLVESPVISKWVQGCLQTMQAAAVEQELPFETHRLIPEYDNTFWVNLLGKGYPFPRKKYRWCTDRLKIKPVNKFVKSQIAKHGEAIMVIGTRKAESSRRAKTMEHYEKKRVRDLLSPNPSLINELVFSPLEDWTDSDVWIFLMQYKNPWGFSNKELLTLYKGASVDGECPMMVETGLPNCGKSRFGCWVCTMVEKDKSMEAMITNDKEKEWMIPLLEFRDKFGEEKGDRERRSFRKMNGNLQASYKKLHHGPYLKEVREEWLRELLNIQKNINEHGPEEFRNLELISLQELRAIRRIWVVDKHEFDDALPVIYRDVMGKVFDDPEWLSLEVFKKSEWDILREIVVELYPDEELAFEMMYSLVDIENRSVSLNQRKGILDLLEKSIQCTYYKNEEDATDYYIKQVRRKKDLGIKYNEKALDSSFDDLVEYDNED